jgi:hypothetical protein
MTVERNIEELRITLKTELKRNRDLEHDSLRKIEKEIEKSNKLAALKELYNLGAISVDEYTQNLKKIAGLIKCDQITNNSSNDEEEA